MKIKIQTKAFTSAFTLAVGVAGTRRNCGIWQYVKFSTKKSCYRSKFSTKKDRNGVMLNAKDTDENLHFQIVVDDESTVEVIKDGECFIHGKRMLEVLKRYKKNTVLTIESIKTKESKKSKYTVVITDESGVTLNFDTMYEDTLDMPPGNERNISSYLTISAADMLKGINRTIFGVKTEGYQSEVYGNVYFDIKDDVLNVVSTDKIRLQWQKIPFKNVKHHKIDSDTHHCLVSISQLKLIKKALTAKLPAKDGTIRMNVCLDQKRVMWYCPSRKIAISSVLFDGKFPKWRQIIPDKDSTSVNTFNNAQLLCDAIVQIRQTKHVDAKYLRFQFDDSSGYGTCRVESGIKVKDKNFVKGSGVGVPCSVQRKNSYYINPDFLSEPLATMGDSPVLFYGQDDPCNPVMLECDHGDYIVVLMPIDPD